MNRYLGRDICEFNVLYERKNNPDYYRNLILKILNQMSQIRIKNDMTNKELLLEITYVHFRYFGDHRRYKFNAVNIADAYRQYLDICQDNFIEMDLYINYNLREVIEDVTEKIRAEDDVQRFDIIVAFTCLVEIIFQFINEWESSIRIESGYDRTDRTPVKCISYNGEEVWGSRKTEKKLEEEANTLFTIYQKLYELG